jgi:N-acetylmuramoyl-L-alanine amidase
MRQSRGIIVIDAGHGGFDAGASGKVSKVREDVLNLAVAKKLERLLEINGFTVIMTREDDKAIASTKKGDMAKREQIIDEAKPDIVISIHMNKFPDSSVSGPMAFYYEKSEEGKMLAQLIQQQLNEYLEPPKPRTFKPEDYFMLRKGGCPCVLVECGFLSNAREEELLQTDEYQEKCAKAIYKGAAAFFDKTDNTEPNSGAVQ